MLYGDGSGAASTESEWAGLVRLVAAGDQAALHALYERSHRVVFTLAVRITASRETAEEVTLDVFHDVWKRAGGYDPANGSVLGWIMNQARSRAIDRVRFEGRKKREEPHAAEPAREALQENDCANALEMKQQAVALRGALEVLTQDERRAIETAYFSELTYVEAASRLNAPVGTVKTRIRSALQKLRVALAEPGKPKP